MNESRWVGPRIRSALRRLRSVPLFWKILVVGLFLAFLFGSVTLVLVDSAMSRVHYEELGEEARSIAEALATDCARPLLTQDFVLVQQIIDRKCQSRRVVRYVIVWDPAGRVLAHTFEHGLPMDLSDPHPETFVVYDSSEGLLIDCTAPILQGKAGSLQLGVSDRVLREEQAFLTRTITWGLVLCASLGTLLALLFTGLITGPIRQLVSAAQRIEAGDFEARARPRSGDEIGQLAVAFNRMGESLRDYRVQVEEKERARISLIDRIVRVQEEERSTISRELHDSIGQSLSALLLDLRSSRADSSLERAVVGLIEEVRRLAWDMRPPVLDDHGLDSALSRYARTMATKAGIEIGYEHASAQGVGRAPAWIEVTLYRIAQEAITNVLRHAGATHASIVLLHGPHDIVLIVEDDGRGFDPASRLRDARQALGLTGMHERARLLGGRLDLESAPGCGTTVRVTIPLSNESSHVDPPPPRR